MRSVFERIQREYGRLDVLVNNVFAAPSVMPVNVPFWQIPMSLWDTMQRVGLRSHLVASRLAVPLMLPQGRGLIVNTSSGGGIRYTFNVAFGVQKAGVDRMARDMAHELRHTASPPSRSGLDISRARSSQRNPIACRRRLRS